MAGPWISLNTRPKLTRVGLSLIVGLLVASLTAGVSAAAQAAAASPVAYWALDDGTGSVAADLAGSNDLNLINAPTWQPGQVAGALEFDGTNGFGEIADSALDQAVPGKDGGSATDFTMMAWINPSALDDRNPILSKQGTSAPGSRRSFMLSAGTSSGDGKLYFELFAGEGGASSTKITSPGSLNVGTWQHVAVSYRFVGAGMSILTLYIDGQVVATTETANGPLQDNRQPFELGRYFWSSGYQRYFDGLIDEVLIFDQELPAQEVQQYAFGSVPNLDPTASFSATPESGKAPLMVSLDASSSRDIDGVIVSYDWDFGDGSTGTGPTVDHTYTGSGSYTAVLTVTDDEGATATSVANIDAFPNQAPIAVATGGPLAGPAPLVVSFDASASTDDGTIVSYDWDFGDGQVGSGITVDNTYAADGAYTALLTITDEDGATATSSVPVLVDSSGGPMALAMWPLDESAGNTAVDQAGDNDFQLVGDYTWRPGPDGFLELGGSTGYGAIPDGQLNAGMPGHGQNPAQDFSLSAWIKLNDATTRNPILSKQGRGQSGPSRGFLFTTGEGSTAGKLYFEVFSSQSAKTSVASDATLISDGSQWHHVAATYDYIADGSSEVRLYLDGQEVAATDSAVGPVQSNPQALELGRYFWTNSYQRYFDGVLDAVQIFGEALDPLEVQSIYAGRPVPNEPPTADFYVLPEVGNAPLLANFDATASTDTDGSIVSYEWQFGDGQTGTGSTVNHSYTVPGVYTAVLTVTDDNGATGTQEFVINVYDPNNTAPEASFVANPQTGDLPLLVSFDATASTDADGSIVDYAWDFGDGSTSSGATVDHTYASSGVFNAVLVVTDDGGRTDTATETITVTRPELFVFEIDRLVTTADRGFPWNQPPIASANGDWTSPTDFGNGTFHVRAEIKAAGQPVPQNMKLQFCVWQDNLQKETCTNAVTVVGQPGNVITWSQSISSMWKKNGVPIDWSMPRQRYGIAIKNSAGEPVSDFLDWNWFGEDPDEWYPLDLRFTVVVVPPGGTFSGW